MHIFGPGVLYCKQCDILIYRLQDGDIWFEILGHSVTSQDFVGKDLTRCVVLNVSLLLDH